MKLLFENVGEDIAFALAEGAKELGFEAVCKDATGDERACKSVPGVEVAFENAKGAGESDAVRVVKAVKTGEGLRVFGDEKGPWTLEYSSTGAFLRGLGLLKRYGVPGKAFDVAETAAFGTVGTMLDCSRNAVMKPESLKRFIRMTALMGFNAIMLYTEDTYEVPGEPYFGHLRGRYTCEELRDIDAYAEKLGVELIPCIQTLAHLKAILRWPVYSGLSDWDDILNLALPETYELIEKCIRTASECFKSRRINIG
ncbi:MAG: family 20 glycosylhydrolase, partial [Lachnospiraceae bacterium]|nr:family 20 glycosylhydrolase [Lachnospiraceae bacterium]